MKQIDEDLFWQRKREKRREDELLRAEFFAKGGVIKKYPMGASAGRISWVYNRGRIIKESTLKKEQEAKKK